MRLRWRSRASPLSAVSILSVIENLLDWHFEQPRNAESEGERGVVLAGLDGIHRLPRDIEVPGKFRLAPIPHGTQHFELVVHPDGRSTSPDSQSNRSFCQVALTLCLIKLR
ncbi:hypothetical protein ERY430_70424 [Erythrobacter sp. EC-HK427]|nr:hypothetical protein ERY430_70424 [Erythrobacter sp. EC-HK427]